MKNRHPFFVLAVVVFLVFIGVMIYGNLNPETKTEPKEFEDEIILNEVGELLSYKNTRFEFGFSFSSDYLATEVSENKVLIGETTQGMFKGLVDIELIEAGSDWQYQNFEEFVLDTVRFLCPSFLPDYSNISCIQIEDLSPIKNSYTIQGQRFYLIATGEEDYQEISLTLGPFVTFNTSSQTPGSASFVLIKPLFVEGYDQMEIEGIIDFIANTFYLR